MCFDLIFKESRKFLFVNIHDPRHNTDTESELKNEHNCLPLAVLSYFMLTSIGIEESFGKFISYN